MPVLRRQDPRGLGVSAISRRGLLVISFYMGLAAAVVQVLLIRELLSLCRGNELIIGMIFSSWFLGIYLGARFNPSADAKVLERRVLISLCALPVFMACSVYGAHAVQVALPRTVGTFYSFSAELFLSLIFTMPAGFFVGYFFPPLVSLVSENMKERSGGVVFYIEALGSCTGGMVFSFVLVELANPLGIASGLICIALIIIFVYKNKKLLPLAIIPLLFILFSGLIEKQIFTSVWNRTHTGKLVHYQRTKYQTVAMESSDDTVSVYGDGILMYTLPDRYESRGLFHLVNALRQNRRKVLLMGSGPGSLLHNLLNTDIERLCYFDPDPELWDVVSNYRRMFYPEKNDSKLAVFREDLRHYLSKSPERFDLIVSIPPAPENIMLNRFYTREFYSLCKNHLSGRGVFITSLHGFSDYMSASRRNFMASIYASFTDEFPAHLKTSGETIYLIGAAGKGVIPENYEDFINRYAKETPPHPEQFEKEIVQNYSPDEMRMFFEKTQIRYFDSIMEHHAKLAGENRDLKPGAYWKYIVLSAFREQSFLYKMLQGFWFLPAAILLFFGWALWDIRRKYGPSRMSAGLVIYCTGFISISIMLVMIVLYQNFHGIVYYRISLINALFMLGLTLGSYCTSRGKIIRLSLILIGIALSIGFIIAWTRFGIDIVYWIVLILFSFLCGAVFPALFMNVGGDRYQEMASVLDAMDHFGAIAGSLLTVMVLLPLVGIQGTLIINMVLVLPALAIALRARSSP
jgi:spermidine synthase